MAEECGCMQLIDGNGNFNVIEFEKFGKKVEMDKWRVSYAVVSIMGPQSGGKSTLLNHLFNTNFAEMDAKKGRNQTTSGIWVAKSGIEPPTLVMDLEGSDGRERGENDANFEKWSALFALAISDIVLINMWCTEIGRENAASRPLLRTVFQVMLRICSPPRKVTLMFVLRDKTKTPLNKLREEIQKDMEEIWNSIGRGKKLEEFFDVKVEALCNYEQKEVQFKKQVDGLNKKICGVVKDKRNVVPASGFSKNAQQIWEEIKGDKELNIPSIKVLVAKFRCDEIANEKFERFKRDYKAKMGSGKLFSSLLDTCLSEYNKETRHYDKVVRSEKRKELKAKLLQLQETDFNRNRGETATAALNVVGVLSTVGIAAAGLAIPGMLPVALVVIPLIGTVYSNIANMLSTRG